MKILIVGDSPEYNGGVCNYTRPIHYELYKQGNVVHYLFSSGGYRKHYNYYFLPYMKSIRKSGGLYWHELINSSNRVINYHSPTLDHTSKEVTRIVGKLLEKIKPEVIHINEMIGLSSCIIPIAKERGIKIIVTVHEYWWLCLHRVMIDFNRKICEGPKDIKKCAFCVSQRYRNSKVDSKIKLALRHTHPKIFRMLLNIKNNFFSTQHDQNSTEGELLEIKDMNYNKYCTSDDKLYEQLNNRLHDNIKYLNASDVIIAVSNEVKQILMFYGVNKNKIIVQHIGSLVASKQIDYKEKKNSAKIIFGFIGGVTYYKGIHLLVEAYLKLSEKSKEESRVFIFGKYQQDYKTAIDETYKKHLSYENIYFLGKYSEKDLKEIFSQINIMVLPSLCNDTAPQTIFESYAAGIPIIGPNIGGFPDFIEHEKNGLLFEVGNSDNLKMKMQHILENPTLIEEYRKNIPKLKTIEENAQELIEIYRSVT